MKNGLIILNKEEGMSSQGAVNRLKKILGADKAGHTGTLDPLATGVLPILLGRAVKASEFLLTSDKHYGATLLLGITTDTDDITGKTVTTSKKTVTEEKVMDAINSMIGESEQIPPMYSAIKIGGKKLYEMAREGKTVEREARKITIHKIGAKKISDNEYFLDILCSKGTYIRTLCADIGKKLGTGGVMKTLVRLSVNNYGLEMAKTLGEIEAMNSNEREDLIIPTEEIFTELRKVLLPPFFARLARCGVEIYQNKIKTSFPIGDRVRLYDEKGFFALGEVMQFGENSAIKPIRQFDV